MKSDRISMLIKKTSLVVEKQTNTVLASYDLTNTQFRFLMLLYYGQEKSIRQIDIENAFAMTNPTVTGILNNLEKKNLIRRCENPDDKRSKLIKLTEQALSIVPKLDALGEEIETQVTGDLSTEEREQLAMLLKKILKNKGEK